MANKGLVLYNSSLIEEEIKLDNATVVGVPINDIANELGNIKVANMVMMGAYLKLTHLFSDETIEAIIKKILGERKADLVQINKDALEAGKAYVEKLGVKYA
jgi:2-oxoglutarate ferredoxin oxidoreductase subunit gamma